MKIKTNELKYCYNDLSIVPAAISTITSRSECNPFYGDDMLPIFTAPMATIANIHNMVSSVLTSLIFGSLHNC